MRERRDAIAGDPGYVDDVLAEGAKKAAQVPRHRAGTCGDVKGDEGDKGKSHEGMEPDNLQGKGANEGDHPRHREDEERQRGEQGNDAAAERAELRL